MLGSHDTFTYLTAEDWSVELISKFWRCQTLNFDRQYKLGVRFFDIRLMRNQKAGLLSKLFKKKNKNIYWAVGHGLAEVKDSALKGSINWTFNSVEDVCKFFKAKYPDAYYRIYLEKGGSSEVAEFKKQIIGLEKKYPKLCWYGIKKPWTTLYYKVPFKTIKDTTCTLFNWNPDKSLSYNIKHFKANYTIKTWAQKNNPHITQEIINDPNTLYFIDYCGIYN